MVTHEETKRETFDLKPEPRIEKTESIKEVIEEEKRIDHDPMIKEEEIEKEEDKKDKTVAKKPTFKFDDDEEDDWEALPPFLRRKK